MAPAPNQDPRGALCLGGVGLYSQIGPQGLYLGGGGLFSYLSTQTPGPLYLGLKLEDTFYCYMSTHCIWQLILSTALLLMMFLFCLTNDASCVFPYIYFKGQKKMETRYVAALCELRSSPLPDKLSPAAIELSAEALTTSGTTAQYIALSAFLDRLPTLEVDACAVFF